MIKRGIAFKWIVLILYPFFFAAQLFFLTLGTPLLVGMVAGFAMSENFEQPSILAILVFLGGLSCVVVGLLLTATAQGLAYIVSDTPILLHLLVGIATLFVLFVGAHAVVSARSEAASQDLEYLALGLLAAAVLVNWFFMAYKIAKNTLAN